jgi:hypothetical protein
MIGTKGVFCATKVYKLFSQFNRVRDFINYNDSYVDVMHFKS